MCVWAICISPCPCFNLNPFLGLLCFCLFLRMCLFLDLFNAQIHNYYHLSICCLGDLQHLICHSYFSACPHTEAVDSQLDWFVFVLDVCRLYFSNFYKYISVWWTADDMYENTTTVVTHGYKINWSQNKQLLQCVMFWNSKQNKHYVVSVLCFKGICQLFFSLFVICLPPKFQTTR